MKEKLAKLIDVKSIVTLALTIAFIVLSMTHEIASDQFTEIFKMIVVFYFGAQSAKLTTKE